MLGGGGGGTEGGEEEGKGRGLGEGGGRVYGADTKSGKDHILNARDGIKIQPSTLSSTFSSLYIIPLSFHSLHLKNYAKSCDSYFYTNHNIKF